MSWPFICTQAVLASPAATCDETKGRFSRPGSPGSSGGQAKYMMMHHSLPSAAVSNFFRGMQNARHDEPLESIGSWRSHAVPKCRNSSGDIWM